MYTSRSMEQVSGGGFNQLLLTANEYSSSRNRPAFESRYPGPGVLTPQVPIQWL
jgi:hypothetical protein